MDETGHSGDAGRADSADSRDRGPDARDRARDSADRSFGFSAYPDNVKPFPGSSFPAAERANGRAPESTWSNAGTALEPTSGVPAWRRPPVALPPIAPAVSAPPVSPVPATNGSDWPDDSRSRYADLLAHLGPEPAVSSSAPPYPYEGDLDWGAVSAPTPPDGLPDVSSSGYPGSPWSGRLPYEPPAEPASGYAAPAAYGDRADSGSLARPATEPEPEPVPEVLPQRVPAKPDVPIVPEPPSVEPSAETPELARIATHLRRDDLVTPQERPDGFDVNAILAAVREVDGVRDAALRTTPEGAHSLRLDLSEGADPADVSRVVARLLQERMGLAAAPRDESRGGAYGPSGGFVPPQPRVPTGAGRAAVREPVREPVVRPPVSAPPVVSAPPMLPPMPPAERISGGAPTASGSASVPEPSSLADPLTDPLGGPSLGGPSLGGPSSGWSTGERSGWHSGELPSRTSGESAFGGSGELTGRVSGELPGRSSGELLGRGSGEPAGRGPGDGSGRGSAAVAAAGPGRVASAPPAQDTGSPWPPSSGEYSSPAFAPPAPASPETRQRLQPQARGESSTGRRPDTLAAYEADLEPAGPEIPRPLYPGERPGPRVVIENVQVNTFGVEATVEVRLLVGDRVAAGTATGPAVDGYLLRLCALATAHAVDELLTFSAHADGPVRCFVEHATSVPFGTTEVAVVVLLLSCGGWVEQLAGSALVAGDPRQAVVRATLNAVNRRLEALLA